MNLTRIRETISKIVKKFSHTSKLPEKKPAIAEGKRHGIMKHTLFL